MLTIRYGLHFPEDDFENAQRIVAAMHAHAMAVGFHEVGPLLNLKGEEASADSYCDCHPLRMLTLQAVEFVQLPGPPNERIGVAPLQIFAFRTRPTADGEEANVGLALHPATTEYEGHHISTNLSGWSWHGWCECENEAVKPVLVKAKELGLSVEVWT